MKNDVFTAIADPNRRKILELLAISAMTVNAIAGHFPISRPAISKHLKILSQKGLVSEQKSGRQRFYHLQPEPLKVVYDWAAHYEKFWNKKLRKLRNVLDKNS